MTKKSVIHVTHYEHEGYKNVKCRLYFVNSDVILTPNHLKYYFYVSSTASFQLACQMHFIFVDKVRGEKNNIK